MKEGEMGGKHGMHGVKKKSYKMFGKPHFRGICVVWRVILICTLRLNENSVGFELVRIVSNDGLICPSFMPYALSNNYKQWTEDPISWNELVNTHKFDTSAVIIGLIKVVLPYILQYFR
jgi:hypothetical protein